VARTADLPALAISADGAFLTHSQAITMVPPKERWTGSCRATTRRLSAAPDKPDHRRPRRPNEDWVIEIRRQNDEAMKRAWA